MPYNVGWIPRRIDPANFGSLFYIQSRHLGWGIFYSDRALCFGLLLKGGIMRKLAFFSLLAVLLCSCGNKVVVSDPASTSDEAKPEEAQKDPKADESKSGDKVKPSDESPKVDDAKPEEAPKASDAKPAEAPKASGAKPDEAPKAK